MKTYLFSNTSKVSTGNLKRLALSTVTLFMLSACGGGGGNNASESDIEVSTIEVITDETSNNSAAAQEIEPTVTLDQTSAPDGFLFESRDNLDFSVEATHGNGNAAAFIGVSVFLGVEEAEYPDYGSGVGKDLVWSGITDQEGKATFTLLIGQAQPYIYITSGVMGKSSSQWVDLSQTNSIQL